MNKTIILIIGIIIGALIPLAIDLTLFEDTTPANIEIMYEDGSFKGCMANELCNKEIKE